MAGGLYDAGPVQRLGSRVLRSLGLTRRHHAVRLANEAEALRAELAQLRQAKAACRATHAAEIRAMHANVPAALRELEFRTGLWRGTVEQSEGHPIPYDAGYAPTGFAPRLQRHDGPTYRKVSEDRILSTGLAARQSFHLEFVFLDRLQRAGRSARRHSPAPVRFEAVTPSLGLTHLGTYLHRLSGRERARAAHRVAGDFETQQRRIVQRLERTLLVHPDMHPSGRNITVRRSGRLALTDVDLAAIDGVSFSRNRTAAGRPARQWRLRAQPAADDGHRWQLHPQHPLGLGQHGTARGAGAAATPRVRAPCPVRHASRAALVALVHQTSSSSIPSSEPFRLPSISLIGAS